MSWLRTIIREVVGLFVDDGRFALAIGACLAAAWLLLPRFAVLGRWSGVVLFAGLAGVLLESALRRARH